MKFQSLDSRNILGFQTIISVLLLTLEGHFCHHEHQHFKWTNGVELSPELRFNWDVSNPEYLTGEILGNNISGYIAIGFSPTGGMGGSDIILGWSDPQGGLHLNDYHAIGNSAPILDKQQNVELLKGERRGSSLRLVFRRKWDTCDLDEDYQIGEDTVRLIWAWGTEILGKDDAPSWHGNQNRGVKSVSLRHFVAGPFRTPEPGEKYWDAVHVDYTVNNTVESFYNCKLLKFPTLTKKHHIIGYLPLVEPQYRNLLHHVTLYKCSVPSWERRSAQDIFDKYLDHPGGDCYTNQVPKQWLQYCTHIEITVTLGSEGDVFPDHVGYPIGVNPHEENYYILDVHYEIKSHMTFTHTPGIRVIYTDKLRKFDVGILITGSRITPFMMVPPKQERFEIKGYCPRECIEKGFPEGVSVTSIILHGHIYTKSMVLKHIRNGVELPPLMMDKFYDFNYQQYRRLNEERKILPGDELILECEYDNPNDTYIVGGLSSNREMCEALIMYYPRTSFMDCRSQYELHSFFDALHIENVHGDMLQVLNLPYDPNNVTGNRNASILDDSILLYAMTQREDINDTVFDHLYTRNNMEHNVSVSSELKRYPWKIPKDDVAQKWSSGEMYTHCTREGGMRMDPGSHIKKIPDYVKYEAPLTCNKLSATAGTSHLMVSWSLSLFGLFSCVLKVHVF